MTVVILVFLGGAILVVGSVFLHGATTAPVMNRLDRLRERKAVEKFGDEGEAPKTAV
jgi:hypothetical protein